jgi:hypothetical protein
MKSEFPGYDSFVRAGTYIVTLGEYICLFYAQCTCQYTTFVLLHVTCILILLRDVLLGLILKLPVGKRQREMPRILKLLTQY